MKTKEFMQRQQTKTKILELISSVHNLEEYKVPKVELKPFPSTYRYEFPRPNFTILWSQMLV